MYRFFLTLIFIFTLFTVTAFAAENEDQHYEYTSETYGFKIVCPTKPAVVVNPFEDPKQSGEMLVFANDGMKIIFGYIIKLDAFEDKKIPDFNRGKKKNIESYLEKLKSQNGYAYAEVQTIIKYDNGVENKGLVAVSSKEINIEDKNGEIAGTFSAEEQTAITYFRTLNGRCVSIQLLSANLDDNDYNDYLKSVSTFRDATDLLPNNEKTSKKSKKNKK